MSRSPMFNNKKVASISQKESTGCDQTILVEFSDGTKIEEFLEWPSAVAGDGGKIETKSLLHLFVSARTTFQEQYEFIKKASILRGFTIISRGATC